MRRRIGLICLALFALAFLLLPVCASLAPGQCANGRCQLGGLPTAPPGMICGPNGCYPAPPPQPPRPVAAAKYEWRSAQNGHELHLRYGGRLIGTYVLQDKRYYTWSDLGQSWALHDSMPPHPLPPGFWIDRPQRIGEAEAKDAKPTVAQEQKKEEPKKVEAVRKIEAMPTGVITEKLHGAPTFSFKGQAIQHAHTIEGLIEGKVDPSSLADDSNKDRLTVISADPAKRKRFVEQFKTDVAYATFRDRVLPWEGAPNDWSFDATGFVAQEGEVYLTRADGEVLARAAVNDVTDPNQVVGSLRKANPNYDPNRDPTPAGGGADPLGLSGLFDFNLSKGLSLSQILLLAAVAFLVIRFVANRPAK